MASSGPRFSRSAFLAGAVGVVLAACGRRGSTPAGTPQHAGGDGDRGPGLAPFAGRTTIDGRPFDAAALALRPTVAWFWAPWCVVCRGEASGVVEVAAEYAGRIEVVGVGGRGEVAQMRTFVADTDTGSLPHVDDAGGEVWAAYGIYGQPAFAFVAVDGSVETFVGTLGRRGLADRFERLLLT